MPWCIHFLSSPLAEPTTRIRRTIRADAPPRWIRYWLRNVAKNRHIRCRAMARRMATHALPRSPPSTHHPPPASSPRPSGGRDPASGSTQVLPAPREKRRENPSNRLGGDLPIYSSTAPPSGAESPSTSNLPPFPHRHHRQCVGRICTRCWRLGSPARRCHKCIRLLAKTQRKRLGQHRLRLDHHIPLMSDGEALPAFFHRTGTEKKTRQGEGATHPPPY